MGQSENYMYNMDEEYTFSKDLKGISMNADLKKKKQTRVKQEQAPEAPSIYGIRPVEEFLMMWKNGLTERMPIDSFYHSQNHGIRC